MATPAGRITLRGLPNEMKVITTLNGAKTESFLTNPAEVATMLEEKFGVVQ